MRRDWQAGLRSRPDSGQGWWSSGLCSGDRTWRRCAGVRSGQPARGDGLPLGQCRGRRQQRRRHRVRQAKHAEGAIVRRMRGLLLRRRGCVAGVADRSVAGRTRADRQRGERDRGEQQDPAPGRKQRRGKPDRGFQPSQGDGRVSLRQSPHGGDIRSVGLERIAGPPSGGKPCRVPAIAVGPADRSRSRPIGLAAIGASMGVTRLTPRRCNDQPGCPLPAPAAIPICRLGGAGGFPPPALPL